MARDARPTRTSSGPGRSVKRPGARKGATAAGPTGQRVPGASAAGATPAKAATGQQTRPGRRGATAAPLAQRLGRVARKVRPRGPLHVTRRALVFFAVLVVLGLSFAGSLRVYLVQSNQLAVAQSQIADNNARIDDLNSRLQRWQDNAYVISQARDRLGWVMPGEVGYRVIGADGEVLSGGVEIQGVGGGTSHGLEARWWDHLTGSIAAADAAQPEVVQAPSAEPSR